MPDFSYEYQLKTTGFIFGLDEAGRGPWCGPVIASCVCWPNFNIPDEIRQSVNDSKKLSVKRREMLFDLIMASNAIVGIGQASAQEIDEKNILQATFLAMKRSLEEVEKKGIKPSAVLIDGNRTPKNWSVPCQAVVQGDSKSLSVAAASIVAKVTRDRILADLSRQYPMYGWNKNAGYGTKEHIQALQIYGVTPHHRKSYAPIVKILNSSSNM